MRKRKEMDNPDDFQALYVLRGPSGSGKSAFAISLQFHSKRIKIVEADMYFTNDKGEYNFDPSQLGAAHKWCYEKAVGYLEKGYSVVVANVNYQLKHYQLYLKYAEEREIPVFVALIEGDFRDKVDDELNKAPRDVVARQKRLWEPHVTW